MQLCDGTLKEYLDEIKKSGCSIEPLEVVEIMIQILSGLCLCHERSICHRDLTLSNSTTFNSVKLIVSYVCQRRLRLSSESFLTKTLAHHGFRICHAYR